VLVVDKYLLSPDATTLKEQVKTGITNAIIAVLAASAIALGVSRVMHYRAGGEAGAKVWFYDQNAKRLYPAPRDLIPPDGHGDVKVRAMVIGFQGLGNNVSQLKIAYLEKYSPELKALLERSVAAHAARDLFKEIIPSRGSAYFQDNFLAKRPGDSAWYAAGTEEARRLMAEWRDWRGPSGQAPIISVPST